jgi:predicted lipoprotein with Yx(FWY)xxD motif
LDSEINQKPMNKSLLTAAFVSALLLAGCSSGQPVVPTPVPPAPQATAPAPQAAPVAPLAKPFIDLVKDPTLGDYLVDKNGMTLYTFSKDEANKSVCADTCISSWPALEPEGPLVAAAGISGTLGVITRDNGVSQVTYNGKPLYTWMNDKKPGDTTGQGVGGVWFVAKP